MIGAVIKDFEIVARIGAGGMGEVWAAEQRLVKTRVAIKMLRGGSEAEVKRFFAEAVAASKIKHAGIVKIFDVGHHEDRAFLIMELLEGESLGARIRRSGRLTLARVADLGGQIASVLAATHAAGITHRDLKPDNIFIVTDAELRSGERAKVLDFGIAKLAHGGVAMTAASSSMGTPAYMAPEQWTDASTADARADLYSLGCVLAEMATGMPPFAATTVGEACSKHLSAPPPRLRDRDPALPAELDDLVTALLAKQPAARPRIDDVIDVLQRLPTRAIAALAATMPDGARSPAITTLSAAAAAVVPTALSRRSRALRIAGAALTLLRYPTATRIAA